MFPQLFDPVKLRKGIDSFVDGIVTDYGDSLGALSDHFERWLGWFEKLLRTAPWWSVVLTVIVVAWLLTRRIGLSLLMGGLLCIIGLLGLWDAGMQTLALMLMATFLSVVIGIPVGIVRAVIQLHQRHDPIFVIDDREIHHLLGKAATDGQEAPRFGIVFLVHVRLQNGTHRHLHHHPELGQCISQPMTEFQLVLGQQRP